DEAITRVLHLDEGEVVEYRGTYSQYRTARRQDEARRARLAHRQQAEISRLGTLADSMRHQTEQRARKARALDTRVAKLRDAGAVTFGVGVSCGYYAQEHEGITPGRGAVDHLREQQAERTDTQVRGLLGMFGITGEMAFQDAGTLSGGEKTKLALAQLVAGRRNLILLDEPTNNLDPPSRGAIGRALAAWRGAMVLVSHDVEFVETLAPQRVLMMPD